MRLLFLKNTMLAEKCAVIFRHVTAIQVNVIALTPAICKNKRMHYKQYKQGNAVILVNQDVLSEPQASLFEVEQGQSAAADNTEGRGKVIFFEHQGLTLVLKKYHRGGLFGRLVRDSYLYTGMEHSRMWREFLLLGQMRDLGLPVPRPIATRCIRTGLFTYQGDMITECIREASTLAELLCGQPLPEATWEAIGRMIQRFHQHHIDHTHLNASKILLTRAGQIYLIDFDKCAIRTTGRSAWRRSNLSRLHRSLCKWQRRHAKFHFEPRHWQALERGYHHPNTKTPSSSGARLSSLRSLP